VNRLGYSGRAEMGRSRGLGKKSREVDFLKNKWVYLWAIVFGLLTTFLVYRFLVSVEKKATADLTEKVVVVAHDIAPRSSLTKEMLVTKNLPAEYIHTQALREIEDAVGCISLTSLVEGEQLLKSKIAFKNEIKNGLAYLIPEGKRALSMLVDEVSGVAGLLKPGDRVDVAAIISISDGKEGEVLSSLIVLQNIPILAVGKNMDEKSRKAETDNSGKKTITLEVTVKEAQSLLLASQKGSLRLLLRSPVDDSVVVTVPFKAQDFLE
jgi:pilus assembly protein CpaB